MRIADRNVLPVAVDHRADHAAEDSASEPAKSFLTTHATGTRRGGENAIRKSRKRHRLQQYASRPAKSREKQPLATEERCLDTRNHLDVVVDLLLHRHEASGVDAKRFSGGESDFVQRTRRMEEGQPVALDALENESLAAKESGADTLGKCDRNVRAARRHEERILLRDDRPAPITQI